MIVKILWLNKNFDFESVMLVYISWIQINQYNLLYRYSNEFLSKDKKITTFFIISITKQLVRRLYENLD